jgi:hypothetical protein
MSRKNQNRRTKARQSLRTAIADAKGLAAINRVKRGHSPTISAAARAEGTTVITKVQYPLSYFRNLDQSP